MRSGLIVGLVGGDMPPRFQGLFPPDVRLDALDVRDRMSELIGEEGQPVRSAHAVRRAEYSTGRVLARRLLGELGAPVQPLERRPDDRVPVWPDGFVGSISHSGSLCLAAVAPSDRYLGVGIDLEPDEPTRREIGGHVLSRPERAWVRETAESDEDRLRLTRQIFSAKEAVYKAFYPVVGRVWRFQDVRVEIEAGPSRARFRAELPPDAGRSEIDGISIRSSSWIACGVAWPRETF